MEERNPLYRMAEAIFYAFVAKLLVDLVWERIRREREMA